MKSCCQVSFIFFLVVVLLSQCGLSRSTITTTTTVKSLYDDPDLVNIHLITSLSSVQQILQKDGKIWMIHLYDSNQPESIELFEIYTPLARLVRGIFHLAVLDMTPPPSNMDTTNDDQQQQQIQQQELLLKELSIPMKTISTPSIYLLGDDKKRPQKIKTDNQNGKSLLDIQMLADSLMQFLTKTFTDRSKRIGTVKTPPRPDKPKSTTTTKNEKSYVWHLTNTNFSSYVYENPGVVAVAFTAPWCGHCKALQSEWDEAASMLLGSGANVAWVDATIETQLAQEYQVKGYPTIKIFPGTRTKGGLPKQKKDAQDYPYERTASKIVQYLLDVVDKTGIVPPVQELTNSTVLLETCSGHNRICILTALPNLYDTGAAGRTKYQEILQSIQKQFRVTAYHFLWFEYNTQNELERTLELSFGSPAVAALSLDRKAYAVHRGSFDMKRITGFIHSITSGRQKIIPLPVSTTTTTTTNGGSTDEGIPKIVTVVPWDGQDPTPIEEEIPLSEIMGDEL